MIPPTVFHILTRQTQDRGPFTFQKLPEVCEPFGLQRVPAHYFLQRLKDFPPNIQDIVVVASTASSDIGIFSRAKSPLTSDDAAQSTGNVFTTTKTDNDSRRAQLPISHDSSETSPIGTAIDLSAKEKVLRPLPSEEMDSSPGPVPALMVLNNEGVLSTWWIIYADSVRQGTTYPGLMSENNQTSAQISITAQPPAIESASGQSTSAFGQSNLAPGSGDSTSTPSSVFGGGNTQIQPPGSAFGSTLAPGSSASPWTATGFANNKLQIGTQGLGQTSFGNPSTMGGSAFGTPGGINNRGSVWGTPTASQTRGNIFGQSSGLGMRGGSAFGTPSSGSAFGSVAASGPPPMAASGGFASFAKGNGFLTATPQGGSQSPFTGAVAGPPPTSTMDTGSSFGESQPKDVSELTRPFSTSGFTLGSTFQADASSATDRQEPTKGPENSFFGNDLGDALQGAQNDARVAQSKETEMAENDGDLARSEGSDDFPTWRETVTPATETAQPPAHATETSTPKVGGLFGTQSQAAQTPAAVQNSTPAPSIFGKASLNTTTTPAETPQKHSSIPLDSQTPPSPPIKPEPEEHENQGVSKSIPEAPLPPESTSKVSYAPGDSSASSKSSAEDAPLPPDPFPSRSKLNREEKPPESSTDGSPEGSDAPLPPDFLPSKSKPEGVKQHAEERPALPTDEEDDGLDDDEGSIVDVAQEISPISDSNPSLRITPTSSFGASFGPSPVSGVFSKPQQPRQNVKSLFGEVNKPDMPHFPPPTRLQQSPRSPSPVRLIPPKDGLRPENARSISAPSQPQVTIAQPRASKQPTNVGFALGLSAQEQRQKEREAILTRHARQQAEEEQDLSDREDERVREELEAEIEATTSLDDFLAHQDYVGTITKPGIAGQIEKVYRDINSMVDTLGLNARALAGFVKGHSTLTKDEGRTIEDLDDDDWCLVELKDLVKLEDQLQGQLDRGRIHDVQEKLTACRDVRKDLSKLRTRRAEMAKALEAHMNEEQLDTAKLTALSASQTSQQHEMRRAFTRVQKLMAEVEENITLLRTRLASYDTGDSKMAHSKKPTVQAVTNTILKMTSMAEKKSGDIDVLEAQMRKLRFTSSNQDSSREGSPFAGPPFAPRNPVSKQIATTLPGATGSPSSSFRRSQGEIETPRRRMSEITAEEASRYRTKMQRRKVMNQIMREAFAKTGPRVRGLD